MMAARSAAGAMAKKRRQKIRNKAGERRVGRLRCKRYLLPHYHASVAESLR